MRDKIKIVMCDTNIIVRYLLAEQSAHGQMAIELFDQVQAGRIKVIILEAVLTETVFVLTKNYQVPRIDLYHALHDLLNYRCVINQSKHIWIQGLKIYSETNLRIVDCLLIAQTKHHNSELITFDQQLKKKAS